jgi:hypothetical protein
MHWVVGGNPLSMVNFYAIHKHWHSNAIEWHCIQCFRGVITVSVSKLHTVVWRYTNQPPSPLVIILQNQTSKAFNTMTTVAKEVATQALRRIVPKGAQNWSRALPKVSVRFDGE